MIADQSAASLQPAPSRVPARAGLGLKPEHYAAILETSPDVGFFELHAENYMGEGGPPHHWLGRIRERYPVSLHGVGLSIGGREPLDRAHLARLKRLIERWRPGLFSEHLAWSTHEGVFFNDLLPVAYDDATLTRVCGHIDEVQNTLGVKMLLENPSTYVELAQSTMSETDFLAAAAARTGCGLLLDVNNVFVSSTNHCRDPGRYLDEFPVEHVGEIHLGGHAADRDDAGAPLLIDAHGTPVADPVWRLYEKALRRCGPVPTLIEWDNDVPAFAVLEGEAKLAERLIVQEAGRRREDRRARAGGAVAA